MAILVPAGFADYLPLELIIMGFSAILIYSAAGIHNAMKDGDYVLPDYSKKVVLLLLAFGIVVSLFNYLIFLTALTSIILGYLYNTVSRFVLLGDSTVLAVTHFALPSFSSSIILDLPFGLAMNLSMILFFVAWFIIPTKNLKDTEEDKNRNYVTLTTRFNSGVFITKSFLIISFLIMSSSFHIFGLSYNFVLLLLVNLMIIMIALISINSNHEKQGLCILRITMLIFMLGLIIEKSSDAIILTFALLIFSLYLSYLFSYRINQFLKLGVFRRWIQK